MHSPYVISEGLLKNRKTSATQIGGFGGFVAAQKGRIDWLELAGRRFPNVDTAFVTATSGGFFNAYLAGNIGQDLLSPFVTVFDFDGYRVCFISNESR